MCHLLLLMPLIALPLFWILPITEAVPLYAGVVLLSAWLYIYVFKALSRPVVTGKEDILHSVGKVIDIHDHTVFVRIHGENWTAKSSDLLQVGDVVKVAGMDELILTVEKQAE